MLYIHAFLLENILQSRKLTKNNCKKYSKKHNGYKRNHFLFMLYVNYNVLTISINLFIQKQLKWR